MKYKLNKLILFLLTALLMSSCFKPKLSENYNNVINNSIIIYNTDYDITNISKTVVGSEYIITAQSGNMVITITFQNPPCYTCSLDVTTSAPATSEEVKIQITNLPDASTSIYNFTYGDAFFYNTNGTISFNFRSSYADTSGDFISTEFSLFIN